MEKKSRDAAPAVAKQDVAPATVTPAATQQTAVPQRGPARVSTTKIDAIESEMSKELGRGNADTVVTRQRIAAAPHTVPAYTETDADDIFIPLDSINAAYLLTGDSGHHDDERPDSGSTQLIDEAAILFANQQNDIAGQLLLDAICTDRLGSTTRTAWLMLMDFYQVTGQREAFEERAIEFASKFEASPPAWKAWQVLDETMAPQDDATTPLIIFSGKLDGAIIKHLERIHQLGERHTALRLEFKRVTAVDPIGCGLLLRTLQRIRKSGLELVIVGAAELAENIRAILQVGRRDETEAPWLLLLELLRLLDREQEFNDASMDFCVTFEVSPPPFSASEANLRVASEEPGLSADTDGHFDMPELVSDNVGGIITAITEQAALHQPVVIDCQRLSRVEFGAAGRLLDGMSLLHRNGVRVEFCQVNHLVAALFRIVGLEQFCRVTVRKT